MFSSQFAMNGAQLLQSLQGNQETTRNLLAADDFMRQTDKDGRYAAERKVAENLFRSSNLRDNDINSPEVQAMMSAHALARMGTDDSINRLAGAFGAGSYGGLGVGDVKAPTPSAAVASAAADAGRAQGTAGRVDARVMAPQQIQSRTNQNLGGFRGGSSATEEVMNQKYRAQQDWAREGVAGATPSSHPNPKDPAAKDLERRVAGARTATPGSMAKNVKNLPDLVPDALRQAVENPPDIIKDIVSKPPR